jgi:hypothetical protein
MTIAPVTYIEMISLTIKDGNGNELKSWSSEDISETTIIPYTIPCNQGDVEELELDCRFRPYVSSHISVRSDSLASGTTSIESKIDSVLRVPVSPYTRTTVSVESSSGIDGPSMRYTIMLTKNFGLFDVVNKHLEDRVRVVNNNPKTNLTGLVFNACTWWHKRDTGWSIGEENQLLYSSASLLKKFTDQDSMYLVLTLSDGTLLETCPDAGGAVADEGSNGSVGTGSTGKKSTSMDTYIYPNPVHSGGAIRLKQPALSGSDDGEERYVKYSLFDNQGSLVLRADASALYGGQGLIMPQASGIYYLLLEGKSGQRWVTKIAVGEKSAQHK